MKDVERVGKRSFSLGPALIGSVVLHVAVIVLLVVEFPRETTQLVLSAVPVEIVSDKVQEAAPTPPAPETPPAPTPEPPQPTPAPTPPAPKPPTPAPKVEPKPAPPVPAPTPKPQPPKPQPPKQKPAPPSKSFDLAALSQSLVGSASNKPAPARPPAPQHARPGQGTAAVSTGPDIDALRGKIGGLWHPNCGAPGSDRIQVGIRLRLRSDGSVADGPHIDNPHPENAAWSAAADRAAMAAKAVRYRDLPPDQLRLLTDRGDIYFKLDERSACS